MTTWTSEDEAREILDAECEQIAAGEEAMRADEHWLDIRVPTAEEVASDRSTVIGTFAYPDSAEYFRHAEDQGVFYSEEVGTDYAADCAEVETNVRASVAGFLNEHGLDTTAVEIRLSEFAVGEIRIYWNEE